MGSNESGKGNQMDFVARTVIEYLEHEQGYARLDSVLRFMYLLEETPSEETQFVVDSLVANGKCRYGEVHTKQGAETIIVKYVHLA